MTPRQQLLQELEVLPDSIIEKLLDFLRLLRLDSHYPANQTSLGEFIDTLVADIPPDVVQSWPTDGAVQHNHYLYGTDKLPQ